MNDMLCSLMLVRLKSRTRLVLKDTRKSTREVRGKAIGGEKIARAERGSHKWCGAVRSKG